MVQAAIVLLYLTATIFVSLQCRKHQITPSVFEGSNLGLLLCVVAGAGEWLGGTATTGVSEYGFLYGISGAWYTVANGLGICFLAFFFARLFRRLGLSTVSGFIGKYVGEKARVVSGCMLIFIMVAVGISQMVAVGTLGETLFGFQPAVAILIMGSGVLLYTILGGMLAVGYTNILHMLFMYLGAILAVILCLSSVGGLSGLKAELPAPYFAPLSLGAPKVISWVIASVLGACTAQAGLQPVLAAKDEKTAVKSCFLIALLVAPFGIMMVVLGMAAKVRFPELANAKLALPTLLLSLPEVAGGLVTASLLAAILSTASPIFLACGTLFTRDIYYKRLECADEKRVLKVSRTAILVAGMFCMVCAIALKDSSTILDIVYFAYSLRGSLFIILLLGIFWKKTSQKAVVSAIVVTGITGFLWVFYKARYGTYPIHPEFSETYIAILTAFFVTVIGSLFSHKKESSK